MDLQRPSLFSGQQVFSLCVPFSIKQQQQQLEHFSREKYFKRQTLNYTTSGRQDRQKPPPLELTEQPFSGNAVENSRRRFCIISFYLEDGTLSVYESTTDYGETRQGPILKRHKMPRADGSGFVTFTDLKLGAELELYGRVFLILECDEFTRWFCKNAGHDIGDAVELPDDTFFRAFVMKQRPNCTPPPAVLSEIRAARAFAEACGGNTCSNKLLDQYLQNDRKVLVFHCYWENPQNFGCRTYYKLHYFLSASTELMKGLNLRPEDFTVGKQIDVYGRQFHIYDCDEFTRQFYREYMNTEQGQEIIPEEKIEIPPVTWPPHALGIGTDEDTLQCCTRITPKRPHPNEREILFGEDFILNFKASQLSKA
ncbi:EF-hand domain-containing family member C2, related [Eimeria maxima]|uniref:EF-hand domain-containing family member C2, related n=1 Tax=Eimeria maxima TaxID=5804 RepID=U6M7B3_EIMMA|nr:EF-hand domain-containing family member C2, related [Eimeria maxima]CDJ57530.1 EF-hand domain-containing family member C2, related [Eimeria maxima]